MSAIVVWIYNTWAKVPAPLRAGLSLFAIGLVAVALAFGWKWPTDWADAKAEVAAFWLVVVPAAYGLFQKWLWPPLLAWLLTFLGLAYTSTKRLVKGV